MDSSLFRENEQIASHTVLQRVVQICETVRWMSVIEGMNREWNHHLVCNVGCDQIDGVFNEYVDSQMVFSGPTQAAPLPFRVQYLL